MRSTGRRHRRRLLQPRTGGDLVERVDLVRIATPVGGSSRSAHPAEMQSRAALTWPFSAAAWSGVRPRESGASAQSERSEEPTSSRIRSVLLVLAASCMSVWSRAGSSRAPPSRRAATVSALPDETARARRNSAPSGLRERGSEVAGNQVRLRSLSGYGDGGRQLERLFSEVWLLRDLRYEGVIGLHHMWVGSGTLNFITEVCTSRDLRTYRRRHRQ